MGSQAVLIVGIGTRYAGDDAAGLVVAERLGAGRWGAMPVITHEGEGLSLLDRLTGFQTAILIDAMNSGVEPGAVQRFDAGAKPLPALMFRHSTHAFGVADAIELGRALKQPPRRIIVYGIEGKSFEAGDRLSPEVEASLPGVVERVLEETEYGNGTEP